MNVRANFFWGTLSAIGRQGINFIATIILARLLLPSDYGILGMLAIIISVSEIIIDAGLGGALIRKKNVQPIDFATLTTYNVIVSFLLYLVIYLASPLISILYDLDELTILLRIYAITIIIESFSIVPKILMIKELKTKQFAITNLVSGALGLIVAIIMAKYKYGVYSLIFQYISTAAFFLIFSWYFSSYKIKFGFSIVSFRELFSFGINTTSANILRNISESVYNNIVAKIAPLNIAGYYNQSYKLQGVIGGIENSIIDSVLFPLLCRETENFVERTCFLNNIISFIFINLCFILMINSTDLVLFLFGNQWIDMVVFLKPLFFIGALQTFTSLYRNVFKIVGKTFLILRFEFVSFIVAIPTYIILLLSEQYILVIYLFLAYSIIRLLMSIKYLSKVSSFSNNNIFRDSFRVLLLPFLSFVILSCFNIDIDIAPLFRIFVTTMLYLTVLICCCEFVKHKEYKYIKKQLIVLINAK